MQTIMHIPVLINIITFVLHSDRNHFLIYLYRSLVGVYVIRFFIFVAVTVFQGYPLVFFR